MNVEKNIDRKSFSGKGVFPAKYAFTLLLPIRNIVFSPKKLISLLNLRSDSKVLEIGPGPGYFSIKVAEKIKNEKLYLFDIQKEMLDYAKKRIEKKGLKNVEYYIADGKTFPFESNFFDIVYMVTVFSEIEEKQTYIKEIHRILKPAGLVSISETAGDPDKMSLEEIKKLFSDFGFKEDNESGSLFYYSVNFKKL